MIFYEKIPSLIREKSTYFLLLFLSLVNLGVIIWAAGYLSLCPFLNLQDKCTFIALDLIPILIALGYWGVSFASILAHQKFIAIFIFMVGSTTIAGGLLSGTGSNLGVFLFYTNFAFLSPLAFHFHITLLKHSWRSLERLLVIALYVLASIEVLPFLIGGSSFIQHNPIYPVLRFGIRLTFPIAILVTILVLAYDFRHFSTLASRRQIRLYTFGIGFALAPLMLSTLLPQTFGFEYIVPGINFPWLLLIPLIFIYSIHRSRLGFTETTFITFLTYYLVFFVLLSIYLVFSDTLQLLIPNSTWEIQVITIIFLLGLYIPLQRRVSRLIKWAFYGSETDYSIAIEFLEQELVKVLHRERLTAILLDELVSAVKPVSAVLFLKDLYTNQLMYAGVKGLQENRLPYIQLSPERSVTRALADFRKPVETDNLKIKIANDLTEDEIFLLQLPHVELWLPILSDDDLVGVMLFSCREGDDFFTEEDKRLLGVVMYAAGAAVRNVIMAETLQAGREELSKAHRSLISAQEQERKRIARELHDDVIQQLLGISYNLARITKKNSPNGAQRVKKVESGSGKINSDLRMVQEDILKVVSQLRTVIRELRPAGLDELGLSAAVIGYIQQVQKTNGQNTPNIIFDVPNLDENISETSAICLFRVTQEGIRNAIKYSRAANLFIGLSKINNAQLQLLIEDDGCGFNLPDRITELTRDNHFGLVGITERVMNIGGKVSIQSTLGEGTKITVTIPYN